MANQHWLSLLTFFKCIGLGVTNCIGIVQQSYTQSRFSSTRILSYQEKGFLLLTEKLSLLRSLGVRIVQWIFPLFLFETWLIPIQYMECIPFVIFLRYRGFSTLCGLYGIGYRLLGELNHTKSSTVLRLKAIWLKAKLPFELWLGQCCPVDPYGFDWSGSFNKLSYLRILWCLQQVLISLRLLST